MTINRAYYHASFKDFIHESPDEIIGKLAMGGGFGVEGPQADAWKEEIRILKSELINLEGELFFEYSVPRIGHRIDVLLWMDSIIFILEFKVGEKEFKASAKDQVWDYALDLKNFHETSHDKTIVPVLIATEAKKSRNVAQYDIPEDMVYFSTSLFSTTGAANLV